MPNIEHFDDKKENPTSHEVHVELEVGQGKETLKLRGLGRSKEDAKENAVVALRKFLTRAETEGKTAIALLEDKDFDL